MNLTDENLHQIIVDSILNIYHSTIRTIRNPNRNPLNQNYLISRYSGNFDSDHTYIIPDRDDISSTILLDIITQFGSPGKVNDKQKIKKLSYKKVKDKFCDLNCPICLDEFKKTEYYRILDCKHVFHKKCIDRWFKKDKNDCPMCRSKIF